MTRAGGASHIDNTTVGEVAGMCGKQMDSI